jgi:MFS family permease
LWGHPDFLKLWAGQSTSLIGSQVTVVALPLVAVDLLHATSGEMGVMGALARAPFLLFLFAGVWADRVRRRPTMIWTDVGRGLLIGTIPLLYLAGDLNIHWMYAIVFLVGVLGVFFEVSNQAHLPALVGREHLVEGNGKLQMSQSVAQVGGPSLAGGLVAVLSAPLILIIDMVSFFVSATACALIRHPEAEPARDAQRRSVFAAISDGVRWVWTQPVIRPAMIATAFFMVFGTGIQALYVLFMRDELHIPPGWVGFVFAMAGVGALLGATQSVKMLRRFGPGPAVFWVTVVGNAAYLLVPLATGPTWVAITVLAVAQFLAGVAVPIAMVSLGSIRQVLTPDHMQGRVVATFRALSLGLAPVGALAAGLLGSWIGLRPTMFIFALGLLIPIVVFWRSPIPGMRTLPTAATP